MPNPATNKLPDAQKAFIQVLGLMPSMQAMLRGEAPADKAFANYKRLHYFYNALNTLDRWASRQSEQNIYGRALFTDSTPKQRQELASLVRRMAMKRGTGMEELAPLDGDMIDAVAHTYRTWSNLISLEWVRAVVTQQPRSEATSLAYAALDLEGAPDGDYAVEAAASYRNIYIRQMLDDLPQCLRLVCPDNGNWQTFQLETRISPTCTMRIDYEDVSAIVSGLAAFLMDEMDDKLRDYLVGHSNVLVWDHTPPKQEIAAAEEFKDLNLLLSSCRKNGLAAPAGCEMVGRRLSEVVEQHRMMYFTHLRHRGYPSHIDTNDNMRERLTSTAMEHEL